MSNINIPFNRPYMTGKEIFYIAEAKFSNMLAGDGRFTKLCHEWLEGYSGSYKALLTHSCTAALEMAAIALDIKPGDEVIMPSYTFVSTANAFVLRGGIPVFVDIREDTLNINEELIRGAITNRTKAIVPVHYAGVACEMDSIINTAREFGIKVIEDAAQGIMSKYKGKPLGSIGDLGAFSFHETKNLISGEGGALLVNDPDLALRAEIIREKGTDRSRFFRGEVDKYTWQEIGSSFLPGEIISAFLWAQLQEAQWITQQRINSWEVYNSLLESLEQTGLILRPKISPDCTHNGHMYYVLLKSKNKRDSLLSALKNKGIGSVFHYVPLHSSPAGLKYGRTHGAMLNTNNASECLIRLPLWVGITELEQIRVVESITKELV